MAIPLDTDVFREILRRRGQSISAFADEWEGGRSRQTVQSWLKNGVPEVPENVYSLCRELDIDPYALLDLNDRKYVLQQFSVERFRHLRGISRDSSLRALWDLTAAKEDWPLHAEAQKAFGRDWTILDLDHRPKKYALPSPEGGYARLHIVADAELYPQVFHFAWKRAGAPDVAWWPYGHIIRHEGEAVRVDNSDVQFSGTKPIGSTTYVETWFGGGGADFRIASLHPFHLTEWEWVDEDAGHLRFPLH